MTEHAAFSVQAALRPGVTLGSYFLMQLIESLTTGPVFLARHMQSDTLHRLRVLILPTEITPEDRLIAMGQFQKVASQLATLQHPSLLPLADYGSAQGVSYLVSPTFSASPMGALLARGLMDPLLVGRYLDGIAAALEYAHQQGILHLNLNTHSVFVRNDDSIIVADFAIPRLFALKKPLAESIQPKNSPREVSLLLDRKGKLLYGFDLTSAPAPELLRGETVDVRTDVYALGALVYQMLTGHRALRGATLQEIVQQHLEASIRAPGVWRNNLPQALDELLLQAMVKEPARRLRSPGELADAYHQIVAPTITSRRSFASGVRQVPLTPFAQDQVIAASPARQALPGTQQKASGMLSRRRVITLAATGGGIVIVGSLFVFVAPSLKGKGSATAKVNSQKSVVSSGKASPVSKSGPASHVLARTTDLPTNSAKPFPLANSNNPGLLIHLPDNRFVAFNSTCTHAGCAVNYRAQDHLLVCPCHSAVFDPSKNGDVVLGPATTPLAPIAITVNADKSITQNQ